MDVPCSRFFMSRPPFCPWGENHAVFWDTKITLDLALSYRVGKAVRPVGRIAVNRDPFRPGSRSAPASVLSEVHRRMGSYAAHSPNALYRVLTRFVLNTRSRLALSPRVLRKL